MKEKIKMMDEQKKRDALGARQTKNSYAPVSTSYQAPRPTPASQDRPSTSFKPK
ncbi:hypothetical protein DSO57_1009841 [Entomophthora muscae]|nr:hypothetical protein DSO57_1009841 [Entomophthora muscae]